MKSDTTTLLLLAGGAALLYLLVKNKQAAPVANTAANYGQIANDLYSSFGGSNGGISSLLESL